MLGLVILVIKQISGYCGILGNSWNFANAEVILIHLDAEVCFSEYLGTLENYTVSTNSDSTDSSTILTLLQLVHCTVESGPILNGFWKMLKVQKPCLLLVCFYQQLISHSLVAQLLIMVNVQERS